MSRRLLSLILVGWFSMPVALVAQDQNNGAEVAKSKWRFEDYPIGRRSKAVLTAFERGDDGYAREIIEENLAPSFRDEFEMSEHLMWFRQRYDELQGNFERGAIFMQPTRVELGLRYDSGKRATLIVEIEEQEPYQITGLGFETPEDLQKQYADVDRSSVLAISSFEDLKDVFNADRGHVRLVTILSAACGGCIDGYNKMKSVLTTVSDQKLKAYVVWMTAFARDSHGLAALTAREMSDPSVRHFWDGENASGRAWMPTLNISFPAWDVYFLYDAEAEWQDAPTAPTFYLHQAGTALPEELHLQNSDSVERFVEMARKLLASAE